MTNLERIRLMFNIEIVYEYPSIPYRHLYFIYLPMPYRHLDYIAFLKDDPEYGSIGSGSTKWICLKEAIKTIWVSRT